MMTRNEFIFSNKTSYRITRHLVFWSVTFFYYWIQSIVPENVQDFSSFRIYKNGLISALCFIPACVFSVYICLYFVTPYLVKKKYFIASLALAGVLAVDIFINYFLGELFINSTQFHSNIYNQSLLSKIALGYQNSIWAITISGFTLSIKFTKNWYLQRKENLKIARNNARTSVRAQKAYLHPAFLFKTLDNVQRIFKTSAATSSNIILQLSDLLSFTLYEFDSEMIPIGMEISAIRNFTFIEKLTHGSDIQLKVIGTVSDKYIPPMLMLSLLQNSISEICYQKNENKIILLLEISQNRLLVKLSVTSLKYKADSFKWSMIVEDSRKKLICFFEDKDFEISLDEIRYGVQIKMNFPIIYPMLTKSFSNPQMKNMQPNELV